ncbi:MAG: ABC transporter permease [Acidobacteriota bacterium]
MRLDGLGSELNAAVRRLLRSPAFSALAVFTFALGIAGTTLLFGVLDQVYLRPLPFPQADRLVRVRVDLPTSAGASYLANVLPDEVRFLQSRSRAFDVIAAQRAEQLTLLGQGDPLAVRGASVSAGTLSLFGWHPVLGRLFTPSEEQRGEESGAVLIGARLWRERFASDPAVLGRTIRLGERFYTVVGVLQQAFPYRADLWLPMRLDSADHRDLLVIGRTAPGVTLTAARTELTALAAEFAKSAERGALRAGLDGTRLRDNLVRDEQRVALALFVAALLFLALAAVNLAGLLAVRAVARRRDLAVRSALGASRSRQTVNLLVEPILVALTGAVLALALVPVATPWLGALLPQVLTEELGYRVPGLDGRIVLFAFAATALAALVAGLVPAAIFSRALPAAALSEGRSAGRAGRERGTRVLLVAQVALVFAILLGAGSLIETFARLLARGAGFETAGVLAFEIQPDVGRYADAGSRRQLVERLQGELAALPRTSAALSTTNPLGGASWGVGVGRSGTPADGLVTVNLRLTSEKFFDTLGIALLRGRALDASDREGAPDAAVVSRRLAQRLWGREDVVGESFVRSTRNGQTGTATVVGVAADVEDAYGVPDTLYLPFAQNATHPAAAESLWILVRGQPERAAWVREVEGAIWRVDKELAWSHIETMDGMRAEGIAQERLGSRLATAFVLGALLLTALGLGGAVAFAVRQRQAEIGVRMALGSTAHGVVRLFAWRGLGQVALGLAIGGAGYLVLRPAAAHLVDGIGTASVWTAGAALLLVFSVGALASYLPARRAARVDPVKALRQE